MVNASPQTSPEPVGPIVKRLTGAGRYMSNSE